VAEAARLAGGPVVALAAELLGRFAGPHLAQALVQPLHGGALPDFSFLAPSAGDTQAEGQGLPPMLFQTPRPDTD
jgi:hypothetical protein